MWNEDTNSWQTTGVETLKTEERTSPDNQTTVAFTTCNATKLAYIALFEGPPSMPFFLPLQTCDVLFSQSFNIPISR